MVFMQSSIDDAVLLLSIYVHKLYIQKSFRHSLEAKHKPENHSHSQCSELIHSHRFKRKLNTQQSLIAITNINGTHTLITPVK